MVVACGAHAGQAKEQSEGVAAFRERIALLNKLERHPTNDYDEYSAYVRRSAAHKLRRPRQLAALSTTSSIVLLRTDRQTTRAFLLFSLHSINYTCRFDVNVHRDLVRATTGVGIPCAMNHLIAQDAQRA